MSAAYPKGVTAHLPQALISCDRFYIVKVASAAMDEVRSTEWNGEAQKVREKLGELDAKGRRSILWAM